MAYFAKVAKLANLAKMAKFAKMAKLSKQTGGYKNENNFSFSLQGHWKQSGSLVEIVR